MQVPTWRKHLMRGLFFLNFISLAFDNWSMILFPQEQLGVLPGVAISFWAGFSLLNLIGIRFPLKMVPILLLQFLYKLSWTLGVYLPASKAGVLDEGLNEFFYICLAGIALNLLILPWGYVYKEYLQKFFRFRETTATST